MCCIVGNYSYLCCSSLIKGNGYLVTYSLANRVALETRSTLFVDSKVKYNKSISYMKKVNIVRTDNGTLSTDTINAMVAECIKAYPSNTQLKANKADIITTFGISDKDYIEVVKAVKAYRLETLAVEVSHIKNDVLTFENWLSKGWEMLSKDNAFNSMMIRYQSVKAKDYSLSSFVYDFYSFILLGCNESDPTIVKPVWRYRLNDSNEIERIRVYEIADTTN